MKKGNRASIKEFDRSMLPRDMMQSIPVDEFNGVYETFMMIAKINGINIQKAGADTSRLQIIEYVGKEIGKMVSEDLEFKQMAQTLDSVSNQNKILLEQRKIDIDTIAGLKQEVSAYKDAVENHGFIPSIETDDLGSIRIRLHRLCDSTYENTVQEGNMAKFFRNDFEDIQGTELEQEQEKIPSVSYASNLMKSVQENMEEHMEPVDLLRKQLNEEIEKRKELSGQLEKLDRILQELVLNEHSRINTTKEKADHSGRTEGVDFHFLLGKIEAYEYIYRFKGAQ